MPWSLLDIPLALPAYVLVLFRFTGLALTAPLYSSQSIPVRVRAALIMVVAAMVFPMVANQAPVGIGLLTAVVGGIGELMIGATIGLALGLLVMGVELGGLIVGRQSGMILAQAFDPTQNTQSSILGQVYTITLMTLFLLVGGHRATLAALLDTFEVIPLLAFRMEDSVVVLLVEMMTSAFILGIRVAGPVLIALFMMTTAMGFLSRTMPQFNILSVGFTLRSLIAMGVAGFALMGCEDLLLDAIWDGLESIRLSFGLDGYPTGLVN